MYPGFRGSAAEIIVIDVTANGFISDGFFNTDNIFVDQYFTCADISAPRAEYHGLGADLSDFRDSGFGDQLVYSSDSDLPSGSRHHAPAHAGFISGNSFTFAHKYFARVTLPARRGWRGGCISRVQLGGSRDSGLLRVGLGYPRANLGCPDPGMSNRVDATHPTSRA